MYKRQLLVYEIDKRRRQKQANRRVRVDTSGPEELFADVLLQNMRRDWAAVKIQAIARANRAKRLRGKVLNVLGRQIEGITELHDVGRTPISYGVAHMFSVQESRSHSPPGSPGGGFVVARR